MAENKYSAKEAAIAVLKKAEEVLKKHKHIGWDKLHSKLEGEGYSKESSDKIAGSIKDKVEKSEPLEKARVDEGLSPQKKATARAKRNDRGYSLNDKAAPKSTLARHNKFYGKVTPGALPGKTGEKIYGKPKSDNGAGVGTNHPSSYNRADLRGRSTPGIHTEWAKKHSHPGFAEHSRKKAVESHTKKLADLKAAPKPNLDKAETGHEKGVNTVSSSTLGNKNGGKSKAGNDLGYGLPTSAKERHATVLGEMKAMPKPKLDKSEPKGEMHPKEKEQAPSDDVQKQLAPNNNPKENAEGNNPAPGAEPTNLSKDEAMGLGAGDLEMSEGSQDKGHIKLAKFMGRMEHKRSLGKKEGEKGIHEPMTEGKLGRGTSFAGTNVKPNLQPGGEMRPSGKEVAVKEHKKVLGEMKAMPKPKLPG